MVPRKAFSLIETLIAIVIASLFGMALLQSVSTASRQAVSVFEHYEYSLLTGALIGSIDAQMYGRTLSGAEILQNRYRSIDDPDLLEVLDTHSYTITKQQEQALDPMNSLSAISGGSSPLLLEKITIRNESEERIRTFFPISSTADKR